MKNNNFLPKYVLIKDKLKQEIIDGKYEPSDGKLPTCRDLVKIFGASYLTVNKAVNLLQDEGYARMIQGSGIFASLPKEDKIPGDLKKVGFLMPTYGDIFQKMFSNMLKAFEENDIISAPLYSTTDFDNMQEWEKEEKFKKFAAQGYMALLVEGTRHFPFKLLSKYCGFDEQLIFLSRFSSNINFPNANYILSDFVKGGYLAADCLLKNSRDKIALITFEDIPQNKRVSNGVQDYDYDRDITEGMKMAFEEHGVDFKNNFTVIQDSTLSHKEERLMAELDDFIDGGGNGIFCLGDNRALNVYKLAVRKNLQIGKDIGVVGYYNTSWTDVFQPGLTSVSIREEEIGATAVKAVLENWKNKEITIEPELIKRESE